jgi:hypothetical protein
LNEDFRPFGDYLDARVRDLKEEGANRERDPYAVGVGLGLLLFSRDLNAEAGGTVLSEKQLLTARQAAARSVLVVMPEYERLAQEMGILEVQGGEVGGMVRLIGMRRFSFQGALDPAGDHLGSNHPAWFRAFDGRGWVRTSDLSRVKRALFR